MANSPSRSGRSVLLESILGTEELARRPSRPPDYGTENRALTELVQALADSPRTILQALADTILTVLKADSAGMSLLTKDGTRFYWAAIAGAWRPHLGGGTPRDFGPCGDVLDCNAPLLFEHWERRYPYLRTTPLAEESLLIPFHVGGRAVGTIWAIAHTERRKFDAEDLRQIESLGRFASAAYQTVASLDALEQQGGALRHTHAELAQHMTDLQDAQDSRRAALNLMEDAVQSQQAMATLNVSVESQRRALQLLAEGAPLDDVLGFLIRVVERDSAEGLLAAITPVNEAGTHFQRGIGPSLPEPFNAAAAGVPVASPTGLCASALRRREAVAVSDFFEDPAWRPFGTVVAPYGLRSGWSTPIISSTGQLLGTFANYYRHPGDPAPKNRYLVDTVVRTAAIAIERTRAEEAVVERARVAALRADIGFALADTDGVREMLRRCAEALVKHLDVAFARLWTVDDAGHVLELQASAGVYTHLDGPHSRVPIGQFKIGRIAATRAPHLTNDVQHDPLVSDHAWAEREGVVAFAGYPILVADRLIGVVAMFARHPLSEDTVDALSSVVSGIALGMERQRTEDERNRLLVSEQSARQDAEEANRLKDEFLATVSHELRTPLNAMLGWLQMLRAGTLDEVKATRALATIDRNAKAQFQLVADLLDVSGIITGKLRFEPRPTDLVPVIEAAVDAVRPGAEAKGVQLRVTLDPTAASVSGDANRLQQVVWNLLTNAIKYTPSGGRIETQLEGRGGQVVITVRDTGEGITADFLPYVFARFRQADGTTTRRHGGLGLGLAIVRYLVEAHGGVVSAASDGPGHGSVFTVVLPANAGHVAGEAAARPESTQPTVPPPATLQGRRVLVVDDEPDVRELLSVALVQRGAEVRTAADARDAWSCWTGGNRTFWSPTLACQSRTATNC